NAIIETATNTLIVGCQSTTIPNSVTSIGDFAFYTCSSLTSITIPNSVTSIGDGAFMYCFSLISITIPNSVTSIGESAFHSCSSLTSLTIPNSVTSIGRSAFNNCSSLTSINIPNSVTSIGNLAFYKCSSLTSMGVESGNTTYDSRENCNAIIETATNTLIAGCQSTIIPNSVTSIGSHAFFYCSTLTSITIPNSVTSIGSSAFEDCSALTTITIPNSVTSIGDYVFWGCSALTSITIPNSVTSIGTWAFRNCSSLTSITIPNSVTSIGYEAFHSCSSLTSITCLATTPPACSDNPFDGVPRTIPLYVPAESVEAYKAADTWKEFQVQALPSSYSPVDLVSITVDGEEIADFDPKALTYNIALPEGTTAIPTIGATAYNEEAQVLLIQATTLPGQASAVVITPDSIQTYTVRFTVTTSSDATLAALQYNGISVPDFLPTQTAYTVQLPYNTIEVPVVTATATHPSARVVIVQAGSLTGQASVVVLSSDGTQSNIYTVQFSLAPSTDATLSSLTYDGMLVPFFEAGTLHYTVDLPSETSTLPQVDAVANDLGAQITIHQATTLPGEASVEVLAADNTTRQTYTIYFSKKSTPTDISDRPDTTETASDKGATKLLRDGQVVILRNGETYDMMGQRL
ncbi:MAG: leucine-rich repeat domain-containing protein, partial [Paludibacteraceae bacterium]|nr:leucine-rich repeat domain-containing protein [Paludibacteraceae bacterium]